jgi:hypothetical protein
MSGSTFKMFSYYNYNLMKHLLSSTAFLIVNKQLAKQVGLKGAVLLADLISKEEYFIANGMTDCWF